MVTWILLPFFPRLISKFVFVLDVSRQGEGSLFDRSLLVRSIFGVTLLFRTVSRGGTDLKLGIVRFVIPRFLVSTVASPVFVCTGATSAPFRVMRRLFSGTL
jgi:hypothetical protein